MFLRIPRITFEALCFEYNVVALSITNNNYSFLLLLLLIIFHLANKFINQTMFVSLSLSFFLRYILSSTLHNRSKEIILRPWRITLSTPRLPISLRGFFRSVAARSAPLIKPSKESIAFQARTFQLNGRNYSVCVIKAAVSFPADRRIGLPNPA